MVNTIYSYIAKNGRDFFKGFKPQNFVNKNPFTEGISPDFFIVNILLFHNNATFDCRTLAFGETNICSPKETPRFIGYNIGKITVYPKMNINQEPNPFNFANGISLVTDVKGYNFLTCFNEKLLSFKFYLKPFQPSLWITMLVNAMILATILKIYAGYSPYFVKNKLACLNFSPYFLIFATFFEESFNVPSKIMKSGIIRIVFGLWTLIIIIFTNSYLGIAITDLNLPLPSKKFELFEDIACLLNFDKVNDRLDALKIWNRINAFYWENRTILYNNSLLLKNAHSPDCFSLLSPATGAYGNDGSLWYWKYKFFKLLDFNMYPYIWYTKGKYVKNKLRLAISLIQPRHRFSPKKSETFLVNTSYLATLWMPSVVEEEIVECGKSAFVDEENQINQLHLYLTRQYKSLTFQKGENIIMEMTVGWSFTNFGSSKLPQTFKLLMEFVIFQKIRKFHDESTSKERIIGTRKIQQTLKFKFEIPQPMNMNGSIKTIFIIWVVFLLFSCNFIILEWRKHIFNSIQKYFKYLY